MNIQELYSLQGKTALITGATGLYGKALSEGLAEAGAHVIIASRNLESCQSWASELNERGHLAHATSFDQSSEDSILQLQEQLLKDFKHIDILVNNSVIRTMRAFDDPLKTWEDSLEVNATGYFTISRVFLNHMMERCTGSMINIGSIQSLVAPRFENYEGYDMTTPPDYHYNKHGMLGLTKYMAALAGPKGVRVNAISPGSYDPDGAGKKNGFLEKYCNQVFLKRVAVYDDIKGPVVFLASNASKYITGQNIVMDGGYTV